MSNLARITLIMKEMYWPWRELQLGDNKVVERRQSGVASAS
jgi:hypothetical protein